MIYPWLLKKSDTEDSVSSCICVKLCCCAAVPPAVNDIIIPTAMSNPLTLITAIVILSILFLFLFSYLILVFVTLLLPLVCSLRSNLLSLPSHHSIKIGSFTSFRSASR